MGCFKNLFWISVFALTSPLLKNKADFLNLEVTSYFMVECAMNGLLQPCDQESVSYSDIQAIRKLVKLPGIIKLSDFNTIISDAGNQVNDYSKIGSVLFVIIILISFLAGGFLVFIISEKAILSMLTKEKEYYIRELKLNRKWHFPYYLSLVKFLKNRKEHYKSELEGAGLHTLRGEIDKLEQQIEKLSSENEELRKKLSIDNSVIEENIRSIDKPEYDPTTEVKTGQTIYFTIPESDGKFKDTNSKSHNDGNSFYRIEFENNSNTGQLFYISGALDKRAIESIDFYLIPVCEIENITNRKNAFRIELIQPGTVYMKNDCWVIDPEKKVKIKFV